MPGDPREGIELGSCPPLSRALCQAAFRGDLEAVRGYLYSGDVDAYSDKSSGTLLISAACGCQVNLVAMLLDAGATVDLHDRWGCTALSAACCPLECQP